MAGTEPKHRDWVKLWIKESLIGTIREDLTAAERGVWYDFLLLAGNSRIPGVICANENTPIPIKRIAGILNITEQLVNQSIEKFVQSGRIEVDSQGIISIINWSKYQYSDYDRQKKYRQPEG
ncbi:MAG: phage replisome organizer N-terminal domain-containing protein [Dehalococcoidales bacterium]|nr:phage replisome organizer N-terminal domain-containing protein [Dehalococcoidales bacterium]